MPPLVDGSPGGGPEPVCIGPTWEENPDWDGVSLLDRFVLPALTLGWQVLKWIPENLLGDEMDDDGNQLPFRLTFEQKRFILWWYAVDENGDFIYRDGVLQRMKGWGKDPLLAVICAVEFLGPCRFAGWAGKDMPEIGVSRGEPVAREHPRAWVIVAAVTKDQTKNTMKLFQGLFSRSCMKQHGMTERSLGKTVISAHGGKREIVAVTSNARALEGNRPTFTVRNETHHWISSNGGHLMDEVIERNGDKSADGSSRALSITNAYEPSDDSVAQRQREAWEDEDAGLTIKTGVLYDSLELPRNYGFAPPRAKGDPAPTEQEIIDYIVAGLRAVRGDAYWLKPERLVKSILSKKNPPSKSRRWWYNQVVADEDAWIKRHEAIDALCDPIAVANRRRLVDREDHLAIVRAGWLVDRDEEIVAFFDGSKSDDATVIVGCRLSDGYCFLIGIWQKPSGDRGEGWLVPRVEVDQRVQLMFDTFNVVAFWGDPSHVLDDGDRSRYWDGYFDAWHRLYGDRLQRDFWAVKTGDNIHSIMWDMTSPERLKTFIGAAERTRDEILHLAPDTDDPAPEFLICGHPALKAHLKAARRAPIALPGGFVGVGLRKENPESPKKIDGAVCVVGARMLRRIVLNRGLEEERPKGGWVYTAA